MDTGTICPLGGHTSDGVAAHVSTGGVLSILTVTDREDDSPAAFVAVHVSVRPAVSFAKVCAPQPEDETMPVSGSRTLHATVTSLLFQPEALGSGVTSASISGAVRSILTVTDCDEDPPNGFVALHVNVVPVVSSTTACVSQPELDAIP